MDVLLETAGFAAKALIVIVTFIICSVVLFAGARRRRKRPSSGQLRIRGLNEQLRELSEQLRGAVMDPKAFGKRQRQLARAAKEEARDSKPNVFVLDFKGDIMASAVEALRHEVTALCGAAGTSDEVVVRLESAGGAAHSYGLAASQLARLRERGIVLTVCVDKIAASGGYMMACVAERVLVAPFAIIGSIGVAAPIPNIHRLLDRHGVDYENVTSGQYKRTVSFFAANSEQGRAKFQEQIEEVHQLFKQFVKQHRPSLDIERVATGEHWTGTKATELGLANELMTSDDYLLSKADQANIFEVSFERPKTMRDRFIRSVGEAALGLLEWSSARLDRARLLW